MTYESPENGVPPAPPRAWHGWWPLVVTASLSVVLVAIILWGREDNPIIPSVPNSPPDAAVHSRVRMLPRPDTDAMAAVDDVQATPYSIVAEEREGTQVLRIRTRLDGDELIVDAVTGRLVAVRDSKGKTISWPVAPMSVIEQPAKSS